MVGGNPRFVLEKETNLEDLCKHALKKLTIHKFLRVGSLEVSKEDEILLLIIHFFVDKDSGYLKPMPKYASQAISDMGSDKLCQ